jgi:hypothetical protein
MPTYPRHGMIFIDHLKVSPAEMPHHCDHLVYLWSGARHFPTSTDCMCLLASLHLGRAFRFRCMLWNGSNLSSSVNAGEQNVGVTMCQVRVHIWCCANQGSLARSACGDIWNTSPPNARRGITDHLRLRTQAYPATLRSPRICQTVRKTPTSTL